MNRIIISTQFIVFLGMSLLIPLAAFDLKADGGLTLVRNGLTRLNAAALGNTGYINIHHSTLQHSACAAKGVVDGQYFLSDMSCNQLIHALRPSQHTAAIPWRKSSVYYYCNGAPWQVADFSLKSSEHGKESKHGFLSNFSRVFKLSAWVGSVAGSLARYFSSTADRMLKDFGYARTSPQSDPKVTEVVSNPLVCKNLNISLDSNCTALITPAMLLVGVPLANTIVNLSFHKQPVSNPVDSHFLDKTIIGTVIDTVTGNSCWAYITIEDKLAPRIACEDDTVSCFQFMLDLVPFAVDECSRYRVVKLEEHIAKLECDEDYLKVVTRKYVAVDSRGNVSDTCTQLTWVRRYDFNNVVCPDNVRIICDEPIDYDALGRPSPYLTGIPYYEDPETSTTFPMWPTTNFLCNLLVDYEDTDLGEINCVRKIMRTWRFREWWCNQELERFCFLQLIEIIDNVGPQITHAPYDFHATTGHRRCSARVLLPPISAKDACHNQLIIDIVYPGGFLKNQNGGYVELPIGSDTIIYRVYDACYNLTTDTLVVHVKDETEPVAICDRRTVVALNHTGLNWVEAEVFDDGSFDECKLHGFEVRRMDDHSCGTTGPDDWGPEVAFCCEDIGKFLMVALKVIDKAGNEAVCMVQVVVQDKIGPHIHCPPNVYVDCRYPIDYTRMDEFGRIALTEGDRKKIVLDPQYWWEIDGHPQDGIAYDNCTPTIIHEVILDSINQCGMGLIKRKFVAEDPFGNRDSCYQRVYVDDHFHDYHFGIVWPEDFDTAICSAKALNPDLLPPPYDKPRFVGNDCSLIGSSYHDHIFSATIPGEPCFKIIRIWKVIDWCQVNLYGESIIWVDTQFIKVYNFDDPVIRSGIRDTAICSYEINCRPISINLPITATDPCTPTSELLFRHKIDYHSDGTIDYERAGIGENALRGTHPLGRHLVKWEVEDRCGNTAKAQFTLDLKNCKAPTAYCLNGLSTSLTPMDLNGDGMPDAAMDTVWAKDFDAGSNHNCYRYLAFSFSADTNDNYIVFDCNRRGLQRVEMWVTDVNGNTSFCRTFIDVQDNTGFCPPTFRTSNISGAIVTESRSGVEKVKVSTGSMTQMTDYDGTFSFPALPQGMAYILKPEKNSDWLNGVSTSDIIRIQRHILGTQTFDSPYKHIAADVNRSGNISARDLADLRKLILGVYSEIPNSNSWRFVSSDYVFKDPKNPLLENFPEQYEINSLSSDMSLGFVAVKVGDLNLDAKTRGLQAITPRNHPPIALYIDKPTVSIEEEMWIPLRIPNGGSIAGLQGTLSWNPGELKVLEVMGNPAAMVTGENFNTRNLPEGNLSFSWDGDIADGDALFSLKVKTLTPSGLHSITMANNMTANLAVVKQSLEEVPLGLEFSNAALSDFVVYQNVPNPWDDATNLRMYVPHDGIVHLSIYDATGRMHYRASRRFSKGENTWPIGSDILMHNGFYYYRLDFEDWTFSQKMLKSE